MQSTGVCVALAILACTALVSSFVQRCTADEIPTDYLPLPGEDDYYRNALWDEVLSKDTRPAGLAPEKMLENFKERSRAAPSARERAFAKQMHEVGMRGLDACNTLTHRFVYEILSLAKQYPNSPALANYVNFLRTIGRAKYAKCAATVPLIFDLRTTSLTHYGMYDRLDFLEAEDAMDMFFAAYANSKQERLDDEQQVYELAKRANLAQGQFNIRRMLKIASGQMSREFMATKPSKFEILQRFWFDACDVLKHPFDVQFGNYNIAVALGSQLPDDISARFLKINEYRRICMAYGNVEDGNLRRQVEAIGKWYKFG